MPVKNCCGSASGHALDIPREGEDQPVDRYTETEVYIRLSLKSCKRSSKERFLTQFPQTSQCQRKHGKRRHIKADNEAMWMGFQLRLPSLPQLCRLEQAVESCALCPKGFLVQASLILLPHLLHLALPHSVLPFLLLSAQNCTRTLGLTRTSSASVHCGHITAMQLPLPLKTLGSFFSNTPKVANWSKFMTTKTVYYIKNKVSSK